MRRAVAATLATFLAVAPLPASSAPTADRTLLDVGDSLSVGTSPYLRLRLREYRVRKLHDVGLHAREAAAIVGRLRASLPSVLVVSAGTNDDPRLVVAFESAVDRIVAAAGPTRCVVWPTLAGPAVAGTGYVGLNRALERAAAAHPALVLVDWAGMVRRHRGWLAADGVHVSAAGYRARGEAIARAVTRHCEG